MISFSVAFGRFNPITIEHERLLEKLNNHELESENKFVFVYGKNDDPLKLIDRISYLKWLYPKITVVPCTVIQNENPLQSLMWLYNKISKEYRRWNKESETSLDIFCGKGKKGIQKGWNEGASENELRRLIKKYNNTYYKNSDQLRMKWETVSFFSSERGIYSGSYVRNLAQQLDPNKLEDIEYFMNFLHSRIDITETWRILKLLNKDTNPIIVKLKHEKETTKYFT